LTFFLAFLGAGRTKPSSIEEEEEEEVEEVGEEVEEVGSRFLSKELLRQYLGKTEEGGGLLVAGWAEEEEEEVEGGFFPRAAKRLAVAGEKLPEPEELELGEKKEDKLG
jgi:hypothetical protein